MSEKDAKERGRKTAADTCFNPAASKHICLDTDRKEQEEEDKRIRGKKTDIQITSCVWKKKKSYQRIFFLSVEDESHPDYSLQTLTISLI